MVRARTAKASALTAGHGKAPRGGRLGTVRVSGFQWYACLGPGRKGFGHASGERCSGLDLRSCDRCPGYAARDVNRQDSGVAYGSTRTGWRSRCATAVTFTVNSTSLACTGSGDPGRTLLEGKAGLAPVPPLKFNVHVLAVGGRGSGVPVPVPLSEAQQGIAFHRTSAGRIPAGRDCPELLASDRPLPLRRRSADCPSFPAPRGRGCGSDTRCGRGNPRSGCGSAPFLRRAPAPHPSRHGRARGCHCG